MSESNAKRPSAASATAHAGFEWAGTVARIRRGGKSVRNGRRAALLAVLSSAYSNAGRGGRTAGDARAASDRA